MSAEKTNPFKELESNQKELLPGESRERVIETVNTVHQLLEVIGTSISLPLESLAKTIIFFLNTDEDS